MTALHQINVSGIDEQILAFAQEEKNAKNELRGAMSQSLSHVRSLVSPNTPRFTGSTKRNWRTQIKTTSSSLSGRFYNRTPFFVRLTEGGRSPGSPAPIENGSKIMPFPQKFVAWVSTKMAPAASELRETVFRVARSVSRKGITPRPFVEPGWKKAEGWVMNRFFIAVEKITAMMSNKR